MVVKTNGTQKESQVIDIPKQNTLLHYNVEYNTYHPEEEIRDFVKDVKNMLSKYEYNRARLIAIEEEQQDILHYIEIANFMKAPEGYKIYRKLAELRRERRACKSENDLLQPVYEHFHATEVLNKLMIVQGECAKAREGIDSRVYGVKTDILDEYFGEPKLGGMPVNF